MSRNKLAFLAIALALVVAGGAFAQQTSTATEKKEVEIISVVGNSVIFEEDGQVKQREVPADFKVNVDGKDVPVSELVPGQKVMIERTTTTKTYPPTKVTKVREGEVVMVNGRTLVYKEGGENKKVTVPAGYKFNVDGKAVALENLKPGMKLTHVTVVATAGATASGRTVHAASTAPKKEEPKAEAAPAPAPAPAPVAEAPKEEPKKLPKTGSQLPLVGLSGGLLLALGAALSLRRRLS